MGRPCYTILSCQISFLKIETTLYSPREKSIKEWSTVYLMFIRLSTLFFSECFPFPKNSLYLIPIVSFHAPYFIFYYYACFLLNSLLSIWYLLYYCPSDRRPTLQSLLGSPSWLSAQVILFLLVLNMPAVYLVSLYLSPKVQKRGEFSVLIQLTSPLKSLTAFVLNRFSNYYHNNNLRKTKTWCKKEYMSPAIISLAPWKDSRI